jgi:hypothetical protein
MSEQINNVTRLRGTTPPLGGSPIEPGIAVTVSANAPGAIVGSPVSVCASDGTFPNPVIILSATVTAPDTVTVQLAAIAKCTPVAKTYNFTVFSFQG